MVVMHAADIQRAIISDRWLRAFVMPNFAPPTWWENDVFEVSKAGYWTEFEVKTSAADFKADARKGQHFWKQGWARKHDLLAERSTKGPSRFYFAMPADLACKVEIPEWAGLVVAVPTRWRAPRDVEVRIERKAPRLHGEKINPHIIARAKETCYYRLVGNYMRIGLEMGSPAQECPDEISIDEWGDFPAPAFETETKCSPSA